MRNLTRLQFLILGGAVMAPAKKRPAPKVRLRWLPGAENDGAILRSDDEINVAAEKKLRRVPGIVMVVRMDARCLVLYRAANVSWASLAPTVVGEVQ